MRLKSLVTTAASAALVCSFASTSQAAQSISSLIDSYELFQIEDDSGEILINSSEGGVNTIQDSLDGTGGLSNDTNLDVGDVLFGYATFPQIIDLDGPGSASLDGVDGNTLTAVFAVEVATVTDANGDGIAELITFTSNTEFNSIYSADGAAGTSVIVLYEDPNDDFNVASGGTPWNECTSLADCDARTVDGTAIVELGFTGDPDESWSAANAPIDISILSGLSTTDPAGQFAFFLGVTNSTIGDFEEALLNPNTGGLVEWKGSGSIYGIAFPNGTCCVTNVFDATDDAQLQALKEVPEPATLGLMGGGLLALSFLYGRRRRSSEEA